MPQTTMNWLDRLLLEPRLLLLAQQDGPGAAPGFLQDVWLPFLMVGVLYYFMVLRPERQQRSRHSELIENLKKNDHVVTAGGLHGVVVNAQPGQPDILLRVDESNNTRIRVQRSSIARVVADGDKGDKTEKTGEGAP